MIRQSALTLRAKLRLRSAVKRYSLEIQTHGNKPAILNYAKFIRSKPNKRALLSYLVDPVLLDLQGDRLRHFSNQGLGLDIPRALNELGFAVDIIDWQDQTFKPVNPYDLFVAHGSFNFRQLYENLPVKPVIVHFATGAYWRVHNHNEKARYKYLEQRREIKLPYDRMSIDDDHALRSADGIICLGNTWVKKTYNDFPHVANLNIGLFNSSRKRTKSAAQIDSGRNKFLFFSSWGNIHKGLDVLLDCFSKMPDKHLYICTRLEPAFENAYRAEIHATPNIHYLGFVPYNSAQFHDLSNRCTFSIFPSSSEGSPGSVTETMQQGVIPLVTKESGIDIGGFGIRLSNYKVNAMSKAIMKASILSTSQLVKMSGQAARVTSVDFSEEAFIANFKTALMRIYSSEAKDK